MKRSEMIEYISRIILDSETEFCLSEYEAELLLSHIEKLGMLPPICIKLKTIPVVGDVDVKNSVLNFTTTQQVTTVNEWEPEDY